MAAAIMPAVVAARGARLQTKAQQGRRTDDIARLLPPGAAAMGFLAGGCGGPKLARDLLFLRELRLIIRAGDDDTLTPQLPVN